MKKMAIAGADIPETLKTSRLAKDMKIGDLVLTRKGYKKVLWSGITQEKAKVYTLKTQKGLELKATLNHKIFTNNAFRDMITLRYGDNIITNTEYIKWLIEIICLIRLRKTL